MKNKQNQTKLSQLSKDALLKELKESNKKVISLNSQVIQGKIKNCRAVKAQRKYIAQIKTYISQKDYD